MAMNLPSAFLRACRRAGRRSKVADSTGVDLSGSALLARTLVLRRLLLREVLAPDPAAERYVGVLLPPCAAAVVANAALPLCGRAAVNLNYTLSSDGLNYCIQRCDMRHVLTSRRFIEKVGLAKIGLDANAELVYLEDFRDKATLLDKIVAGLATHLVPLRLLARWLGVDSDQPDDVFTVIFTSGSTGEPKGVMLTAENIRSNVAAVDAVVHLQSDDVVLGILPFFHSFGFTITLWTVLSLDLKGAYHVNPLEAREVGKLCRRHGATILLSAPTFLRSYLKRCEADDLRTLEVVVTGAEQLPVELADAFEKKFGVRPVEGYGATELSPLASVNIPPSRAVGDPAAGIRAGTVGRCVPQVTAKVVDPETGADLGVDEPGMLLVKGPNVMRGYLGESEATAKVLREGWYVTGDIAQIDADGFITITGRESRFSKIGGEMVPHVRIEELLSQMIAADGSEPEHPHLAVTAVPDDRKGERLVVVYAHIKQTPEELRRGLKEANLPPLWIPSPDSFIEVDELPVLGSGKLDLRALKELALNHAGP